MCQVSAGKSHKAFTLFTFKKFLCKNHSLQAIFKITEEILTIQILGPQNALNSEPVI